MLSTSTSGESRPRARWLRALAVVSLGLTLAIPTGLATSPQPAIAADDATAITEGSVVWGFKESWRNYIGADGAELSDGVSLTADGLYDFPVKSGSFDAATNSLTLDLGGTIHYSGYCSADGCLLDSIFSDLRVEISEGEQVVRGTYQGRPENNPGGPYEVIENAVFGQLDISDVEPIVENGRTQWSNIPATAKDVLYGGGTAIDPVTIDYAGPGGKPSLEERWDNPGVPVFTPGAEWSFGTPASASATTNQTPNVFASPDGTTLFVLETAQPAVTGGDTRYIVRALDAVTFAELGSNEYASGDAVSAGTAFDPETATVFFTTGDYDENWNLTPTLQAARWDAESRAFSVTQVAELDKPYHAGGLLVWNAPRNAVVWSNLPATANAYTGQELRSYTPTPNGWSETVELVQLPAESLASSLGHARNVFGSSIAVATVPNTVALADGSMVIARGGTYVDSASVSGPRPLIHVSRTDGDDGWIAKYLPGTIAVNESVATQPFSGLTLAADGASLLAYGSAGAGLLQYITFDDGELADVVTVDPDTEVDSMSAFRAATDPGLGFDYALDRSSGSITVLRDRVPVSHFTVENLLVRGSTLLTTADHGIITNHALTSTPDDATTLRRFDFVGVTPEIVEQPADTQVALVQGATSGATRLAVQADASDSTVQWQRKFPTEKRFTSIDGAVSPSLDSSISLEQSGTEFRAVVTNAAGSVVSQPATVTVVSAPRFAQQPVSLSVYDGDTAVFTAPIAPGITGEQRWEQLNGGDWVELANDDAHTADGATLSVVASGAVSGQQFRSVLTNEVGENFSDTVTLTVVPKVTVPEGGLMYTGVGFEWDGNAELQHKSPVGAANYLSAGISDGTASTYLARSGDVTIMHDANGQRLVADYSSRESFLASAGRQLVRLSNGVAKVQADGSAVVTWSGSWSVNMYGGMVPFTFTNPVLTVQSDGTGTLTADLSGYAGSMSNPDAKTPLTPVSGATISTFQAVKVDVLNGFTVTPDYRGVEVTIPVGSDAVQQQRTGADWGAWPQSFVDFQIATGLSSYWYSSGANADANKVAHPFLVDFSEAREAEPEPTATAPLVTQHPQSVSAQVGDRPSFSASASGDPAPSVQWQSRRVAVTPEATVENAGAQDAPADWEDVAEATSPTFTSPRIEESDAGAVIEYRAVFANSAGSVATNAATLEIAPIDAGAGSASSSSNASGAAGAEGVGTDSQAGATADSGSAGAGASGAAGVDQGGSRAADGGASGATTDLAATGTGGGDVLWIAAVLLLAAGSAGLVLSRRRALRASTKSCNIR